jgi:hypothetical protein
MIYLTFINGVFTPLVMYHGANVAIWLHFFTIDVDKKDIHSFSGKSWRMVQTGIYNLRKTLSANDLRKFVTRKNSLLGISFA